MTFRFLLKYCAWHTFLFPSPLHVLHLHTSQQCAKRKWLCRGFIVSPPNCVSAIDRQKLSGETDIADEVSGQSSRPPGGDVVRNAWCQMLIKKQRLRVQLLVNVDIISHYRKNLTIGIANFQLTTSSCETAIW
jgi:hypothetical protein